MNITINVDETQFKDLLEKELKDMPKEEIHDLVKLAFTEYFTHEPNALRDLFVTKNNSYYGAGGYYPTDFTKKIFSEIDFSDITSEIIEPIKEMFKNNIHEIIENVVARSIAHSICNAIVTSGDLEDSFMQFYNDQKAIENQNR